MNEIEKVLRSVRPKEPSSSYFGKGMTRIGEFRAPSHLVNRGWQYATIALTGLLVASLIVNVTYWTAKPRTSPMEFSLVSTELRREGDLLIREFRYEPPRTMEPADE